MPETPILTPIASQPLSVILLARNEEPHIEAVLQTWTEILAALNRAWEIILVDGGSSDRTMPVAQAVASAHPGIQVVSTEAPSGIGATLRVGLARAQYPLVFYTTADNQYRPADISLLLAQIDKVHLISGYRTGQATPLFLRPLGFLARLVQRLIFDIRTEKLPGWLGWKEHLYRLGVRTLFGVRSRDINCVYRLARRSIFARTPLQANGPFVHTEILVKANFLGAIIGEEMPIAFKPRYDQPDSWSLERYRMLIPEGMKIFNHADFGPISVDGWPEPTSPPPAEPAAIPPAIS